MAMLTLDSDTIIKTLLGKEPSVEIVDALRERLKKIVLPWRRDGSSPPRWVRLTGDGKQVGIVDAWLDGYGDPGAPWIHGWGYKASGPSGYGVCTKGIVHHERDGLLREGLTKEQNAYEDMTTAMARVDSFLMRECPFMTLLHEELPEPPAG